MLYFTTFFDKNYLSRGLVLIESLQNHVTVFKLFVLGLDQEVYSFFNHNKSIYPQVSLIKLIDIEEFDSELLACKNNRKLIEYYFTLSPCLPLFLLKKFKLPHICSLDADIKFYNSPEILFNLKDYSIIITPHKFSKEILYKEKMGLNNVSFQIFKNDVTGNTCLELWRKQCIDWCKDELDTKNNRFADQKYLDNWDQMYKPKIKILNDTVSGLAVWNINNYIFSIKNKRFYCNNEKIIFYHFHHHKFLNKYWATNGFFGNKVRMQKSLIYLYKDYWDNVLKFNTLLNIKKDKNIRHKTFHNKIIITLLEEKTVFLRLSRFLIIPVNFQRVPFKIKKILRYIYA